MPWLFTPYALVLFITTALLLAVALMLVPRRHTSGGSSLLLMVLAVGWWALMAGLEAAAVGQAQKIFFRNLLDIGAMLSPSLFLIFALNYRGQERWLRRPFLVAIVAPALIFILLTWSNPLHHLIWTGFSPGPPGSNLLHYQHGPAFTLVILYVYLCVGLGTSQLALAYWAARGLYRRQAGGILFAALFPWVGSLIYFVGPNPWPDFDLIPVAFGLTAVILAASIWRLQLFDLSIATPVARDLLVERASEGMLALDAQNRLVDINPAAQRMLGLSIQVLGQPVAEALATRPEVLAVLQSSGAGEEVRLEGDPPRFLGIHQSELRNARSQPAGRLVTVRETTGHKIIEQALHESRERYYTLIEQAPLSIALVDTIHCKILYANSRFADLFEVDPENALDMDFTSQFDDPADRLRLLAQLDKYERVDDLEVCFHTLSGWHFWALVSATHTTWNGQTCCLAFFHDITARRQLQQALEEKTRQLERLAITDGLTQLFNRRYADQVLETEFARAARYGKSLCLALLDLDHLKQINACCGHAGGDRALHALAELLRENTRTSDITARIGGDEFLIIFPQTSLGEACTALERLRQALAATPLIEPGAPPLSVSVGLTAWHPGDQPAQALLRADQLLFQAKEAGRNRIVY